MRKAFSLIELLIVIMIIGVVYTLSISNFSKLSEDSFNITLGNLKEYLLAIPHKKSAKLLCLNNCLSCDVIVDGAMHDTIDEFLDSSVNVYRYELSYGFVEREENIFFNIDGVEEAVCFSYEVDNNGVGDQVLVEFKNKFYDFSTYFNKTAVYNSMNDAAEAREELVNRVMK